MSHWAVLLGGLLVWLVHFFGLYAIGEIAPSAILVLVLSAVCLAADLWLLAKVRATCTGDQFAHWQRSVGLGGAGLSLLAVVWQTLPVIWT